MLGFQINQETYPAARTAERHNYQKESSMVHGRAALLAIASLLTCKLNL